MGWSYGWSTRQSLVRHITKEFSNTHAEIRCIAQKGCGFTKLWTLWEKRELWTEHADEAPNVVRFVVLFQLRCVCREWGYRACEDGMGPCEKDCPLSYVERCTASPEAMFTHQWRAEVRAYHHARGIGLGIRLKPGMSVPLKGGFGTVVLSSVRRFSGTLDDGRPIRIKRQDIDFETMLAAA